MLSEGTPIIALLVSSCIAIVFFIRYNDFRRKYPITQRMLHLALAVSILLYICCICKSLHLFYYKTTLPRNNSMFSFFFPDTLLHSGLILSLIVLLTGTQLNRVTNETLSTTVFVYSILRIGAAALLWFHLRNKPALLVISSGLLTAGEFIFLAVLFVFVNRIAQKRNRDIYSTYVSDRFLVECIISRVYSLTLCAFSCSIMIAVHNIIEVISSISKDSPESFLILDISSLVYVIYHAFLFYVLIEVSFLPQRPQNSSKQDVKEISNKFFKYKFAEYVIKLEREDSTVKEDGEEQMSCQNVNNGETISVGEK